MPAKRTVFFGRVNRRYQPTLIAAPFREEMERLVELGRFTADDGQKHWIVGDLEINETLLTGMIGFIDTDSRVHFDDETNSWVKGFNQLVGGASPQSVVPFAIELDSRWTACVASQRVRPATFRHGLELALNAALQAVGWNPDWEVDLVSETQEIEEWLLENPDIRKITRLLKLPNPGRDISDDIEQMRKLGAGRKTEGYTAPYNRTLDAVEDGEVTDAMKELIQGVEVGQVQLTLEARLPNGEKHTFSSATKTSKAEIEDFGEDWELGMTLLADALRHFARARAARTAPPT